MQLFFSSKMTSHHMEISFVSPILSFLCYSFSLCFLSSNFLVYLPIMNMICVKVDVYSFLPLSIRWCIIYRHQNSKENQRAFLVRDNWVFNGPLGRSLRSFARTAHSAHSAHLLRSAPLCYACFACSLRSRACSLTLPTPSWDSWNSWICVHAVIVFHGNKRVFRLH